MTTVEEIKQLKIELPPEEEITGYKSFYNRVVKRAIDFVLALFLTYTIDTKCHLFKADRKWYNKKQITTTKKQLLFVLDYAILIVSHTANLGLFSL